MRYKDTHLCDQDLIMAADGELSARRRAEVSAHLDACWSCRARMHALENAIGEFVRARNRELNPQIPSGRGPGALLRVRLREASQAGSPGPLLPRAVFRVAPVAGILLCILAVLSIRFQASVNAEGPKPVPRLTPGATRPITVAEVCRTPDAEVVTANISEATRRKVFAEYGIRGLPDNFEVDYLITPDLGGDDSIRNLWPQPYSTRWNAHVKDRLEQRLHELVCAGKLDLPTAQHDIAADWIGAYKKYFRTSDPSAEK